MIRREDATAPAILLPDDAPPGPVLAHCDARRTHRLVRHLGTRAEMLGGHVAILRTLGRSRPTWVPTFNYDFCSSGTYDTRRSESQVGPITETFRVAAADWRSSVPVFNFAGTGTMFAGGRPRAELVDPFGADSGFGALATSDGVVLWYGTPISSTTLIHYVERCSGGPLYRYDKLFEGVVHAEDDSFPTTLRYHVRPWGRQLDYDWSRLERDLIDEGIHRRLEGAPAIAWASVRSLCEYWVNRLSGDPLYLLDGASRSWVEPELQRLGRRFVITDFESDNHE